MLFHRVDDLVSFGYMDSNFKAGKEEKKPTPRYLFTYLEELYLRGVLSTLVLLTLPWK